MKLKVFSGLIKVIGVQRPTIVAAPTRKRAAELLGRSVTTLRDYWVTSEDAHEIPVVAPITTDSTFYADGWSDARANRPSSPPDKSVFGQEYLNGYQAAQMAEDE
jgi:hypothetical protein